MNANVQPLVVLPTNNNKIKLTKGKILPDSIGWWFGKHPETETEWWCKIYKHEEILLVLFPLAGLFRLEGFFKNNMCDFNNYDWAGPFTVELHKAT